MTWFGQKTGLSHTRASRTHFRVRINHRPLYAIKTNLCPCPPLRDALCQSVMTSSSYKFKFTTVNQSSQTDFVQQSDQSDPLVVYKSLPFVPLNQTYSAGYNLTQRYPSPNTANPIYNVNLLPFLICWLRVPYWTGTTAYWKTMTSPRLSLDTCSPEVKIPSLSRLVRRSHSLRETLAFSSLTAFPCSSVSPVDLEVCGYEVLYQVLYPNTSHANYTSGVHPVQAVKEGDLRWSRFSCESES